MSTKQHHHHGHDDSGGCGCQGGGNCADCPCRRADQKPGTPAAIGEAVPLAPLPRDR